MLPRRRASTLAALLVGAAIAAATVPSSAQQTPPRDAGQKPATTPAGSASIFGTVVDGVAGTPIRRVIVSISDQGSGFGSRMTVTEDDGSFAFRNLPAGRYLVTGTKAAYLATANGVNKPMRPGSAPTGSAIALTDGQHATDVVLRMTRGSVVTGVVRGPDGRPVRGVNVSLAYSLRAMLTGERTLAFVQGGGAVTDLRGAYRLFGVPPGEYIASVRMSEINAGVTNDLESTTDADVRRIRDLAAGRSTGPASTTAVAAPRRPTYGYATVFYPGTTVLANAVPITVGPGEERGGVDFQLQLVPQSRVSGVVTAQDGRPASGIQVRMSNASPYEAGPFLSWLTAATDAQGGFVLRAVPAGDYVLEIRPPGARGDGTPAATSWARTNVSVAPGVDVSTNVTLQPGRTVTGQITIDPASSAPPPDFARMQVMLMNRDGLTSPATITADGRFTVAGVLPDAYRLSVYAGAAPPPAAGWFAKSGTIGGRDVLDAMIQVAENVSGAAIVLTDRVTEVSGAILDGAGRPAPEYFIVIFPEDQNLWTWQSRRIQRMRPASDGKFVFRNLPAGEYLIGAVTDLEQNQWYEPAFLSQMLGASVKITLADGDRKVQDIRLR